VVSQFLVPYYCASDKIQILFSAYHAHPASVQDSSLSNTVSSSFSLSVFTTSSHSQVSSFKTYHSSHGFLTVFAIQAYITIYAAKEAKIIKINVIYIKTLAVLLFFAIFII
jgi:hypothetical protein